MVPELKTRPMPEDDGAPFCCDMHEEKPRPIFRGDCGNPGIVAITNPSIIKTNCPLWAEWAPEYKFKNEWFFLCADHLRWITNSLIDDDWVTA
jgi:hypothetical protein